MKRRGFTLIELMVVIAIIIILAAIAIPNYLKMTERAKKSRIASDMATLATGLETFKTDWGTYPIFVTAGGEAVNNTASVVFHELAGTDVGVAATSGHKNTVLATNAVGETNPSGGPCIEYLKAGTLTSMVNPFDNASFIMYRSDAGGTKWVLHVDTKGTIPIMYRSDSLSTPAYAADAAAAETAGLT